MITPAMAAFENAITAADPLQQKTNQAWEDTDARPLRFALVWDVSWISWLLVEGSNLKP